MKTPHRYVSPPISRAEIAQVCAATNDPHPLHLDPDFARAAGFRDVVVPAHLLIGWVGQYLQTWGGATHRLQRWSLRFTAPVWPDDILELAGEPRGAIDLPTGHEQVEVEAFNQQKVRVGVATAEFAPR